MKNGNYFDLREEVDAAIKKLIAHDSSWSRILARRLEIALKNEKRQIKKEGENDVQV